MILNYKFKNFMSFKENVEFSMVAPKTKVKKRFPDNFITTNVGVDVLKTAVVVGENAGGKSNFIRSLSYFQSFFLKTESTKAYNNFINTNNNQDFCPKKSNTLQSFEIEIFVKENIMYLYHLEVDFVGIVKEELYFKKLEKNKYKKIFSVARNQCQIECKNKDECINQKCYTEVKVAYIFDIPGFEKEIERVLENAANKEKALGLTVTKLAMLGNEHGIAFTDWVKNVLCPETNIINYDIYKSMKNEVDDLRILHDSRYLDIFRMIDYSIIDLKVDEEKPFSKTMVIRKKKDGGTFSRDLVHDSSGVREFFAWAVQIFKVVYENKIVFADEMDRVLNPVLSDRVISFINGKNHFGQFIFTTHNVLHLDLKNYMKEQIYFVTKDIETLESELYSLADFPEIRYETTKIYEFYMKGILGGTAIE
ncbi:AAA15 family ATPase/GTPase [Catenibacillus scindens]|uniref:AAA15 family ATPase/GTPase n=1 Tax=Catenibacillus scindens TaxID=673271 RepID=A0A7W8HBH8_9FIRM|nr:AAA family ATPase [Catenibacillus scindens]MBB5264948.1 AAA15 family ATPase/GTPase [Catenibacillus scindens]